MRILSTLFLALLFTLSFVGCKKKDDEISTRDALIQGRWKLTALTVEPGINTGLSVITNLYAQEAFVPSYEKDDVTIFASAGTYQVEEGALKQNPTDPAINATGMWSLSSDSKALRIQETGELAQNFTLISVSKGQFKGTTPFVVQGSSITYTITATWNN